MLCFINKNKTKFSSVCRSLTFKIGKSKFIKLVGLLYNPWHQMVKQMVCKHISKKNSVSLLRASHAKLTLFLFMRVLTLIEKRNSLKSVYLDFSNIKGSS